MIFIFIFLHIVNNSVLFTSYFYIFLLVVAFVSSYSSVLSAMVFYSLFGVIYWRLTEDIPV